MRANSSGFTIPIRGGHIFDAIFPAKRKNRGTRYSIPWKRTVRTKYYVLGFFREGDGQRIYTERKLWIERSRLTIARQQVYLSEGPMVSDITYSNPVGRWILSAAPNAYRSTLGWIRIGSGI